MSRALRKVAGSLVCAALLIVSIATISPLPAAFAAGLSAPVVGTGWSSAVTGDPAAVYWNPAMLAFGAQDSLLGSLSIIYLHLAYERERLGTYQHEDSLNFREPISESSLDRSKTGAAGRVAAHQVLPTAGGFGALALSPDVTLGFGLYAPYGAILKLDESGPQRWSLQSVSLLALYATPSISIKLTDWLSVGASAGLVVGNLGIRKIADLAGTSLMADALGQPPINQPNDFGPAAPPSMRELDVMGRPVRIADAWAVSGTFILGVAAQPTPNWTLGLAYEFGAPLTFRGEFDLDMSPDFFTQDLASQGLKYPSMVRGDAWVQFSLPHIVRLGVAYHPEAAWDLRLQLEWVGYSSTQAFEVTLRSPDLEQPALGLPNVAKLDIARQWQDVFTAEAMFSHDIGQSLRLGARLGYHSPFSPDTTVDVSSPDGHRVRMSLLGRLALYENLDMLAELDIQFIVPRHVQSSDYDLANGRYALALINAGGALRYRF